MRISELTFELGDTVLHQLAILDRALNDIGLPPVSDDFDFEIHSSSSTFGLDISVIRSKKDSVPIDFHLEGGGFRIDIDQIQEAFNWSDKDMEDSGELITFIKQLLTSYVLMEYYGTHTIMCFFDRHGQSIFKTTLRYHKLLAGVSSVFSSRDCTERLFLPVYGLKPTESNIM